MGDIKVLQVGLSSYPGGVENAIMNYFRFSDREKIHYDFLCTENSLAYSDEIEKSGGRIFYVPSLKKDIGAFKKKFSELLRAEKYDVVHINMLSAANIFPVVYAHRNHVKKIIVHAHNSYLPSGILKKTAHHLLKHTIGLFTKNFMACSPGAARWLFGSKKSKKAYILHNAVDYGRFSFNSEIRDVMRKKYGIDESTVVIGHVGRFNEEKNHKFLVELFCKYKKINRSSKLVLVGDGIMLDTVKKQVEDLGLVSDVIFVGSVSDASSYYQMMDLFCMPSHFEGLGIVAIEAQSSGLPCICSTGVPNEAIISCAAKRISLDDNEKWLSEMVRMGKMPRISNMERSLTEAGYNIICESKKLENYYLE